MNRWSCIYTRRHHAWVAHADSVAGGKRLGVKLKETGSGTKHGADMHGNQTDEIKYWKNYLAEVWMFSRVRWILKHEHPNCFDTADHWEC